MIDNSMREPETLGEAFKNGYDAIFGKQWPIWVGGILFGMINVFMFAFERPWSSANGIRNWDQPPIGVGDQSYTFINPMFLFSIRMNCY